MNINKIISEEINKYIMENVISEEIDNFINEDLFAEKKRKSDDNKDIAKNGKKLRKGLRTDFDRKKDRETNPNLTNQDNEDIADIIDNPAINTAAVAHELRPDLTPTGAQSELRKKVKGLKSDSGSTYKLKKKEAHKLRRILARMLH